MATDQVALVVLPQQSYSGLGDESCPWFREATAPSIAQPFQSDMAAHVPENESRILFQKETDKYK
ncbi:hypothetical protein Leryth_021811 [Lithospermum erythrorhizon]|nr:hypothetical protein Leryth_021811 [Lithospermum erythrorhizon]